MDFVRRTTEHPITFGLWLLSVVVTLFFWRDPERIEAYELTARWYEDQPWRLLSCTLPHGNLMHLVMNLLGVLSFGRILERTLGPLKLLGITVVTGTVASAAEYAVLRGGIGLSGILYGYFGYLLVQGHRDQRLWGALDSNTKATAWVWFFLCIAMEIFGSSNVANWAHGGGLASGYLLGRSVRAKRAERIWAPLAVVALVVAVLLAASVFRHRVNFARIGPIDLYDLTAAALKDEDFERAVDYGERALRYRHVWSGASYNLGLARFKLGRFEDAKAALLVAADAPGSTDEQRSDVYEILGLIALELNDPKGALEAFGRSLDLNPEDGEVRDHYEEVRRALAPASEKK